MFRVISILIVAFWIVMTTLMVRENHFANSGQRNEVEVDFVLNTFFSNPNPGGEYELLKNNRRIGLISILARERKTPERTFREVQLANTDDQLMPWNAVVHLSEDSKRMEAMNLRMRIVEWGAEVEVNSKPGGEELDFVVRNQGGETSSMTLSRTLLQDKSVKNLLSPWGFSAPSGEGEQAGSLKAYEQVVEIAGRKREVYTLVASLGPDKDITAYFSQAGELIWVETFVKYQLRQNLIVD